MDQLLEELPKQLAEENIYRSFIYQPERISLNSRLSLKNPPLTDGLQYQSDYYSSFTNELKVPLLRVQTLQLLRASIPNALTSIPNSETAFYYYRIGNLGAPGYEPDYSQLDVNHIRMVRLLSSFVYSPDNYANPNAYGFNKTFEDYQDLVDELNKATLNDPNQATLNPNFFIPGDITFSYNATLNKIVVRGNNYQTGGNPNNYYLPVGYADPNLQSFINLVRAPVPNGGAGLTITSFPSFEDYTLNRRLGFVWDGVFLPNPALGTFSYSILANHTFPKPDFAPPAVWVPLINYTAESYADLVYSANLFLYCDIVGGSTQDTNAEERLLAVIPTNASNLGVVYGESKIDLALTKVSQQVSQMTFVLRDDKGELIYFPTNAYINLEMKISYM